MSATGYIRGFDGIRGISILLVLMSHLAVNRWLPDNAFVREVYWGLFSGEMGVSIFFTLSGFLITNLLLLELERTGSIDLRKFYIRRFLRLLPPLVVFILVNAVLMALGLVEVWAPGLLVCFFYLYNFIPKTHFDSALGHTWSLAVEEQFYLLWPLALRTLRVRTSIVLALAVVALSVLAYLALPTLVIPFSAHSTLLSSAFEVRRTFIPAVAAIMVGSAMAMVLHRRRAEVERWAQLAWWPIAGLLLYAMPLFLPADLLPAAVVPQAFGVALILVALIYRQVSAVVKGLEWFPLAYLGRISYGVYLYHVIFMGTAPGRGLVPMFPLNILVALAFAILSYEFMERPVLRLKSRFR